MVHEATFDDRSAQMAIPRGHSTARMAGAFAAQCQAKSLLLTHFRHLHPPPPPTRVRRFWPSCSSPLWSALKLLQRLVLSVFLVFPARLTLVSQRSSAASRT